MMTAPHRGTFICNKASFLFILFILSSSTLRCQADFFSPLNLGKVQFQKVEDNEYAEDRQEGKEARVLFAYAPSLQHRG